ncbi:MAG: hypothetical protein HYW48_05270 [Deltaproteobacteria bacterium]|nr:hypothetical protein [Deltaproteobacteria bacterium]
MRAALLVSLLFLSQSCDKPTASRPFKAKVVVSTEDGYRWQELEFKYLQDPDRMRGDIGDIVGGVVFNIIFDTDIVKEDPESLYSKKGGDVKTDYLLEDGVILAQNMDTLAMFSLYKAFEICVDFWKDHFGLSLEDQKPSRLLYDPQYFFEVEGTRVSAVRKRNASYLLQTGDFMINKTSSTEHVPLKVNLAVLAHEYGHKIFNIQFARRDVTFYETKNKRAETQLLGINEGWADFASWLLTQRAHEFEASIPALGKERSLPVSWTNSQLIKEGGAICGGQYYCKGSLLASSLYELSQMGTWDAMTVGKHVFDALLTFRDDWEAHKNEETFDFYYFLIRIVNEFEEGERAGVCTVFKKWFDDPFTLESMKLTCPD